MEERPNTRLQTSIGSQQFTQAQAREVALKPIRDFLGKIPDINYPVEKVTEIIDQKLEERYQKIQSLRRKGREIGKLPRSHLRPLIGQVSDVGFDVVARMNSNDL